MGIRVALNHRTVYRYDRPVIFAPHTVRLRPAPHTRTPILSYSMKIEPAEHFINWQQDPFGNWQARLVFPKPTPTMCVEIDLVAELAPINPFDFFLDEHAETSPFKLSETDERNLAPYLETLPIGTGKTPKFEAFLAKIRQEVVVEGQRTVDLLVGINTLIQSDLRYDIRMEPGVFSPEETLARGHGSCRDFAWLLVQILRQLGFGARFVSGYSIQLKPDRKPLEGPAGVSVDCTDLHAWAEAYLPGAGWVGLDATSGLMAGEGHIPLAATADPSDAAPISGTFGWAPEGKDDKLKDHFEVSMRVDRLVDRPRSTKPYTDEQWEGIQAAGEAVDRVLQANDVRLTMGGEPTFVSVDDMDGAEWNVSAVGVNKEKISDALVRRLRTRFFPGGILHHGQGKWYPGEPLPRWAYSCYGRRDGEPVWKDPNLFADNRSVPVGIREAKAFAVNLAGRLGVSASHLVPGYEDVWYNLWRERRMPVNVDPLNSRLEDPVERENIRRQFAQGLSAEVGLALPLRTVHVGARFGWVSGRWVLRDDRLYLLPGDSAMGYRLPLDSLPWAAMADRLDADSLDPTAKRERLPLRQAFIRQEVHDGMPTVGPPFVPVVGQSAKGQVRTAMCFEPRNGVLHVFMPPVYSLEEYLDLVTNIEETAHHLKQPIRVEGYHPPEDHRLRKLSVTPDPGVIEVNVHPASSWKELVDTTTGLYQDAHEVRLGTEKFMLDGRHSGTGGGNHVVLGGATPNDSPFLRRPDLLRSMVAYWNNHPSLSYLFSGLFVGPTSQAPRLDDARQDALDELELAFAQMPKEGGPPPPPWLVDRLFRNLLVDSTGNTHRAEFCIDKLYSPDSSTGRLGLLELRGFEMPPDARMSLAQQLLVRSLVAHFWKTPYRKPLIRWGTTLSDRFMLPHFVDLDFADIVDDLASAGLPIRKNWFEAHHEFRFPLHGQMKLDGMTIALRQAIEPWHVLGEEPTAGGTVRYVDSAVERLECKVDGIHPPRHTVTCNGYRLPLVSTGTAGQYVAGVRFKAWQPPNGLHPRIGIHGPLTIEVVDTWKERSLGGCTYHVVHPGGRFEDRFPTNALEAESRRNARFQSFGYTPGRCVPEPVAFDPRFPTTLDLRKVGLK
ncbi:MAG: transglutaminase family protein [Deltaproteobacteria bacterium]|nr:transglutaminase family protein [Deltaproteobacteria bacterium]